MSVCVTTVLSAVNKVGKYFILLQMKSQGLCHGRSYRVFVAPALQLKLEVKSECRNTVTGPDLKELVSSFMG